MYVYSFNTSGPYCASWKPVIIVEYCIRYCMFGIQMIYLYTADIIGFNHGVLGLAENPARGTGFWSQNAYALGVLTPKASPSGWVFSQGQHPMIKTYYSMSLHCNTAIMVFQLLAIVEWKRHRADISSRRCC